MVLINKKKVANWEKVVMQLAFVFFTIVFLGSCCGPTIKMIEQLQLFQFTAHYFSRFAMAPGGLLMYAGKFFTQFFFWPWMGAVIIAFVLWGIQWLLNKLFSLPKSLWALSFLPSVLLLILQTSTGHLLAHSLGLLSSLVIAVFYKQIGKKRKPGAGCLLLILAYIFAGGHVLLILALFMFIDLGCEKVSRRVAFLLFIRVLTLAVVFLVGYYWLYTEFSLQRVIFGALPDVLIMPDVKQKWLFIFTYTFVLIIGWLSLLDSREIKETRFGTLTFNFGLLILLMALVVRLSFTDKKLTILLRMDQAVQEENWDEVLDLSRHIHNSERLVTYYTNIALCKSGRLADEMFCYDQSWFEKGLFIPFAKNPIVPLFGGEVYYQLGLVNYAYRWTYEGMVMHEISTRHLKRLFQVALINEEKELAEKYGETLSNGLFYDNWVKQTARDAKMERKRKLRPDEDFLIGSDFQFGALLKFAFQKDNDNQYLYDYMMAYFLLSRDLDSFADNLDSFSEFSENNSLPRHFREALVVYAMREGKSALEGVQEFQIGAKIWEELKQFNTLYKSARTSRTGLSRLKQRYGDTYWYYYLLTIKE